MKLIIQKCIFSRAEARDFCPCVSTGHRTTYDDVLNFLRGSSCLKGLYGKWLSRVLHSGIPFFESVFVTFPGLQQWEIRFISNHVTKELWCLTMIPWYDFATRSEHNSIQSRRKDAPRHANTPQDALGGRLKLPQDITKRPQDAPVTPPEAPQDAARHTQDVPRHDKDDPITSKSRPDR